MILINDPEIISLHQIQIHSVDFTMDLVSFIILWYRPRTARPTAHMDTNSRTTGLLVPWSMANAGKNLKSSLGRLGT